MSASTSISRRVFEALGHKLAQLSAKDTIQTKPLADIDFDSLQQALSNDKNAFHEHIPKPVSYTHLTLPTICSV